MTTQQTATSNTNTTLVLGGTGKTGRRIAARLTELGVPVRIGSRSNTPPFVWEDPATWADAVRGVQAVYISYAPDLAVPGAPEAVQAFTELAVKSGVRRLVLLSGRNEYEAQRAEKVVQASGVEWTIVRASWFNQNFSEGFFADGIAAGEVALPVGDVGEPFIDTDDIADVATAALTDAKHAGQVYEITGPRLLTFADAVQTIAKATGRDIRFKRVTLEEFSAMMREFQIPDSFIDFLTYLFTEVLDGRSSQVTDGVQRALGRPARDFADYARETAATGVWNAKA